MAAANDVALGILLEANNAVDLMLFHATYQVLIVQWLGHRVVATETQVRFLVGTFLFNGIDHYAVQRLPDLKTIKWKGRSEWVGKKRRRKPLQVCSLGSAHKGSNPLAVALSSR